MTKMIAGERSPLLIASSESTAIEEGTDHDINTACDESNSHQHENDHLHHESSRATLSETIMNICKTCMGTGTLALPFAAKQGGILINTFGTILIVAWNVYVTQRLVSCLDLLSSSHSQSNNATSTITKKSQQQEQHQQICPPEGTSTLATVAFYALGGSIGIYILDSMTLILLVGVLVAYEDGILSFLSDTPFTTGRSWSDAIITAIIIGVLSNVPDMGYLSKASALGLSTLFLTFVVIMSYGNFNVFVEDTSAINWWPQDARSLSYWFGCTVFGYGTVPLTFNLRESMAKPQKMVHPATTVGLSLVGLSYLLIGTIIYLQYPHIKGDVFQVLPTAGLVPTMVRVAMVGVILVTSPLLVVPCAEIIEGKLYGELTPRSASVMVRIGICIVFSVISFAVPSFVDVLSFVGSFCVATVSFVMPPFLHICLAARLSQQQRPSSSTLSVSQVMVSSSTMLIDMTMLLWGVTATAISTSLVFHAAQKESI